MGLESTFDFPDDLNAANPANGDDIDEGAAHLRGIKSVLRNFAADFDGSPLSKSILDALYPPGVLVALNGAGGGAPSNPANPGNQLGGTWVCFGQLKTLATVDENSDVPGGAPESYIYLWYRTA